MWTLKPSSRHGYPQILYLHSVPLSDLFLYHYPNINFVRQLCPITFLSHLLFLINFSYIILTAFLAVSVVIFLRPLYLNAFLQFYLFIPSLAKIISSQLLSLLFLLSFPFPYFIFPIKQMLTINFTVFPCIFIFQIANNVTTQHNSVIPYLIK